MSTDVPYITRGAQHRTLILAWCLGIMLAIILLMGAWTAHISQQSCVRVAKVDRVIQEQGLRGLKTLGKPGGVGFAYYQAHPAELALARKQLRQQIADFTPSKCSTIF